MDDRELEAEFTDETRGAEAIKNLRRSGVPMEADVRDVADPLVRPERQGEDINTNTAAPLASTPVMTRKQFLGSMSGALIGCLILGAVAAIIGAVVMAISSSSWITFGAIVVGGGVAGLTAGAIIGGREGGESQMDDEERAQTRVVHVEAHPRSSEEARDAKRAMEQRRRTG
ncbi:MAG: hypothetical protein ABR548_02275 [Actinomycetota bacterium]